MQLQAISNNTHKKPGGFQFPRLIARCSASALVNNYEAIQNLVPTQAILPMIKANAYGHGAIWAARQLCLEKTLYGFGVATMEEARELRAGLEKKAGRVKILVFSSSCPWNEEKGLFCEKYGLTPVISTDQDWYEFLRGGWPEKIPYELKFNTGMNRLGISIGMAGSIARALRSRKIQATRKDESSHPSGVLSHLASAESHDSKLSQVQYEKFLGIRRELGAAFPAAHFHLANSSGIWNEKLWGLKDLTDVVRPGISLYGIPPWPEAPSRGIIPVMTVQASILNIRSLKAGEKVGYGGTFQAGKAGATVAVISAGYADGIKRTLSNQGHVWIGGKASHFAGTISMDLSTVLVADSANSSANVTPNEFGNARCKQGDWVEIIGPHVDPWAQAKAANTIPYDLLTSLSSRVQKIYE